MSAAEELLRKSDDDIFLAAGIELPSHLNTKTRRWASFLLVAISGAFCAGPVLSWPTLEPLLISEGVWAGPSQQANLTNVFSIALGVSMVASLAMGMLYDALGPRTVGIIGACGAIISLCTLALAIEVPSLNGLLWIAYPCVVSMGILNRFDVYAWLWLLPDDQSTVSACAGAITCISDSFVLVAVFLHDAYGIRLSSYFMLVAALSTIAGFLALLMVPSQQEIRRIEQAVLARRLAAGTDAGHGYGAIDSKAVAETSAADPTFMGTMQKSCAALKDTCILYCKVHPAAFCMFSFYQMAQYMFTLYQLLEMYPFYKSLMGVSTATRLVDIFGGIYAFTAAASLVLFGKFVDYVGMHSSIAWVAVLTAVNAYLYTVPSVACQAVAQVLGPAFIGYAWYIFVPLFCVAYGPPELFGTSYGINTVYLGIGQIILTRFGTFLSTAIVKCFHLGKAGSPIPYFLTIDLWCFSSELASVLILWWWWCRAPLPRAGTTTMADVRRAAGDPCDVETMSCLPDGKEVFDDCSRPERYTTRPSSDTCCSCLPILRRHTDVEDLRGAP